MASSSYQFLTQGFTRQLTASLSACMSVLTCGSSFGWVAPTLVKLQGDTDFQMSSSEISWMIAIMSLGNILSAIPAGLLADRFGRKPLILISGPLYIVSWVIVLRVKTFLALCLARVLQGLALGIVLTIVPMYLGEIASQHIRGAITGQFFIAFYLGFLYEFIIGPFVSYDSLTIVSMCLPIVFLVLFVWQPESPHYYIMRGRMDEAETSLLWLRGTNNVDDIKEELVDITQTVQKQMRDKASYKDIIATPTDRRALLIIQVVSWVRILSGVNVIISYSTDLFQRTGFTTIPPYVMTIILGTVRLISGFSAVALSDLAGRRPLLIISTLGCAFFLSSTAVFFYYHDQTHYDLSKYNWVRPICIILFYLFVAFGLEPVSITYRSELFPANTRAVASSISSIIFSIGVFILVKVYQITADSIGIYFIFMLFSIFCFLGSAWMYFYAIETKNKSLAEIQMELSIATTGMKKENPVNAVS